MKLNVYVDGFNLYYGSLYRTNFKWLNQLAFCQATFPSDHINRIRYFTARVKERPNDPDQPVRQATLFRALRTLPNLKIHEGSYIEKPVTLPEHPIPAPPAKPKFVTVVRSEEKGSDVNLATYLLMDAFKDDFEAAVVISNDSDLAEPIRLVRTEFRKRIIILFPCSRPGRSPSIELRRASGLRSGKPALVVDPALLAASQFPTTLTDANGTFTKPASW
ncbi:NYN domain-containing protein [Singulisphaera sp. PoT]|uniref:NYN domain-containing protein n=1 Tax=Singulisphaera sp. PoT TaxID=3411797 RepID=UPI003BF4C574